MKQRFVWLLPLVLATVACKHRRAEPGEDERPAKLSGYGNLAWAESERSPSVEPREVCVHLAQMVAAESGQAAGPIDEQMMAECESELSKEAAVRGTDNWNAIASCVLEAQTEAALDACDRANPMPPQAERGGSSVAVGARELEVCAHMIDILLLESAAQTGETPQLSAADREDLNQTCAESLVVDQKPTLSPADYEQMLACIEQASVSADLRLCQ